MYGDQRLTEATVNISTFGMFIETRRPPAPGSRVEVLFQLPGLPGDWQLGAEVRWVLSPVSASHSHAGMGVRFSSLTRQERKCLESFVENWRPD